MFTIRLLSSSRSKSEWTSGIVSKIFGDDPGAHMTEAPEDDIASVVQVLCVCCCTDEARPLFAQGSVDEHTPEQLSKVAFAMMGEAVSRGCRILVRRAQAAGKKDAARSLLRQALGITLKECVQPTADSEPEPTAVEHSALFSVEHGRAASGRFFSQQLTNCAFASFGDFPPDFLLLPKLPTSRLKCISGHHRYRLCGRRLPQMEHGHLELVHRTVVRRGVERCRGVGSPRGPTRGRFRRPP